MKNLLLASLLVFTLMTTAQAHMTTAMTTTHVPAPTAVTLTGTWKLVTLNGMEMEGTITFTEDKHVKFVMNDNDVIRDGIYTFDGSELIIKEGEHKMTFKILELTEESLVMKDDQGEVVLER